MICYIEVPFKAGLTGYAYCVNSLEGHFICTGHGEKLDIINRYIPSDFYANPRKEPIFSLIPPDF
jgi:hypothetical protein